jgi:hypothetical protein
MMSHARSVRLLVLIVLSLSAMMTTATAFSTREAFVTENGMGDSVGLASDCSPEVPSLASSGFTPISQQSVTQWNSYLPLQFDALISRYNFTVATYFTKVPAGMAGEVSTTVVDLNCSTVFETTVPANEQTATLISGVVWPDPDAPFGGASQSISLVLRNLTEVQSEVYGGGVVLYNTQLSAWKVIGSGFFNGPLVWQQAYTNQMQQMVWWVAEEETDALLQQVCPH